MARAGEGWRGDHGIASATDAAHDHLSVLDLEENAFQFPGPLPQLPEGLGSRGSSHRSKVHPPAAIARKNQRGGYRIPDTLLGVKRAARVAPTFNLLLLEYFLCSVSFDFPEMALRWLSGCDKGTRHHTAAISH
eukprot:scaffold191599_cov27-Tisochrysis_lutea.AAC.2